jgi:predicted esterase
MRSHLTNKKGIFAALAALVLFTTTDAAETRYKDRLFGVEKNKDVVFATDVPYLSAQHLLTDLYYAATGEYIYFYSNETDVAPKPLLLDLYTPKGDKETKRAVVIVSHGGAMVAGAKDDTEQQSVNYCDSLTARGFVTASIQYRRGVSISGKNMSFSIDSVDFARSVYRGVQDVSAAVRYMRKNATKLGIDPNRIYLLGNSSGAILSLENIYAQKTADFPSYIKKSDAPDLGDIDIYGEQGVDSHANGVVALWGAVHNTQIIGNSKAPVLLVHGTDDETVYFKTGRPLSGGFSMSGSALDIHTPTLYGSFVIDSVLKAKNIEHETYFVEGEEHEFYDNYEYETPVKDKVFNFLYKLASTDTPASIKHRTFAIAPKSTIQMETGNMQFSITRGNNLKYAIMDIRGRATKKGIISVNETVDLSALNSGVYILRVQGEQALRFCISR